MKKLLLSIVLTGMFAASVQGQIIIDGDDMPNAGDTIRTSATVVTDGINFEEAGADIEWDFSELFPGNQRLDTFVNVDPSSIPLSYWLVFNPIATIASPVQEFDMLPGANLTDIYQFFRESDEFFGNVGIAFTLNGMPLPLAYDEPDVYYNFPVTYLSVDSSESSFSISLPGVGYLGSYRKRVNHVDAWGTVTTPYGTFPSIRVKSFLTTYDSIYVDSIQFGQGISRTYIEYKWLADNMGIPVIQIDKEGFLVTARYIDSLRIITGTEHLAVSESDFRLFPNPASDHVFAEISLQQGEVIKVEIFDLAGRLQSKPIHQYFPAGSHTRYIQLKHLLPGVYVVRTSTGSQAFIRKLLVN